MESIYAESFDQKSSQKALDIDHRKKINFNIGKYNAAVDKGLLQFDNLEYARKKAHSIKWRVMENLDKYLLEFESNFMRKG